MASFSSSSSSSSSSSTDVSDAVAKSLAAATAQREAQREADLPQYDYKGKRKMPDFFDSEVNPAAAAADKTAPSQPAIGTSPNMARSSPPPPSTDARCDYKGKAKMLHISTSDGNRADETARTKDAVSGLLALHSAGSPTSEKRKNATGPSPNMAQSFFPPPSAQYDYKGKGKMTSDSDENPADEMIAPTKAGSSTHVSLHSAGQPIFKKTKIAIGTSPNMARSSFPSSSALSDAQSEGKGNMFQLFDEVGVSTHLRLRFAGPHTFKQIRNAIGPSPNMARSSFPSSSVSSDAQFDIEAKGKVSQLYDFLATERKLGVDTSHTNTVPTQDPISLFRLELDGPTKKTAVVVSPRSYSPPPDPRRAGVVVVVRQNTPEDRWDIKKVLTESDVNYSYRLLLPKVGVEAHILPHVMGKGKGVEIAVWDADTDTDSEHVLVLKKWESSRNFVLVKNWMSDFVRRRELKENDEIGVRWDEGNSRLEFTVLNKNS